MDRGFWAVCPFKLGYGPLSDSCCLMQTSVRLSLMSGVCGAASACVIACCCSGGRVWYSCICSGVQDAMVVIARIVAIVSSVFFMWFLCSACRTNRCG